MMEPLKIIKFRELTPHGNLYTHHLYYIKKFFSNINYYNFILLPSDTGYSFSSLAVMKNVYRYTNIILNRKEMPISTSFFNYLQVKQYVYIEDIAFQLLLNLTPGPLTLVVEAKESVSRIPQDVIKSKDNTIGVRIPDSIIEREIANLLNYPITTVAVRDTNGNIIQNFDEALERVIEGIKRSNIKNIRWIAIEGQNFFKNHSTVIKLNKNLNLIEVLRLGSLSIEKLEKIVSVFPTWTLIQKYNETK